MNGMKQIPLPATKEPSKSSGNDNLQKKNCTKKTSLPETKEPTNTTNNDDQQIEIGKKWAFSKEEHGDAYIAMAKRALYHRGCRMKSIGNGYACCEKKNCQGERRLVTDSTVATVSGVKNHNIAHDFTFITNNEPSIDARSVMFDKEISDALINGISSGDARSVACTLPLCFAKSLLK
jgi:hypothetical protein